MSVDTAMSRVLEAEKDAVDRLAASERRAHDIVREARESVRALRRRHQVRVSRLYAGYARKTGELVAELEKDAAVQDQETRSSEDTRRRLEQVVSLVARELTEKGDAR